MSGRTLCAGLRISLKQLDAWENGEALPSLMQVPMLCGALGLSYEAFFGNTRKPARGRKRAPKGCWQCSLLPAMYRYVICDRRVRKGLTQQELARRAGASPLMVEKWEQGKAIPKLDEVPRICDALGIRLWQFFE